MNHFDLEICFSNKPGVVRKITELQAQNLRKNLRQEEIESDGFVFVEHEPRVLQSICDIEPAVVALDGEVLAGYAICMAREFANEVPELRPFFRLIDSVVSDQYSYITCGQVCIKREYRGRHLMAGLYNKMSDLKNKYDYCITEISIFNTRSLHAHKKIGFQVIHEHTKAGETWLIVLWNWNNIGYDQNKSQ